MILEHLRLIFALPIVGSLALSAMSRAAGAQAPDARAVQAPRVGTMGARTVKLSYVLYGRGFHVLNVVVELRLTPQGYWVRLNDRTAGFLGFMLHTDVTSTVAGRFVPGGVQPVHFESSGYSRGAQRDTVLDYTDGNPAVRVLTPTEPRRDPVDPTRTRGSIDTLSAMADMVHLIGEHGRCDGHALVFDGLRLSQVSSTTVGQQTVPPDDRSPYGGATLRCDFVSLEVGGVLHNEEEAKMRLPQHGSAWVSPIVPGAPPLPVRIKFEHPRLGLATMFLTKVEQSAAPPGG